MREVTRLSGLAWRTVATAAVVTLVQWLVVSTVHDIRAVLVVLAIPALFAGVSVARLLAETSTTVVRRGQR